MKASIGIAILIFFLLSLIDMSFGSDCKLWNQFYFIKENAISMLLCLFVYFNVSNINAMLISLAGVIFFGERIIFNLFWYEYHNSTVFALVFCLSIILLVILAKIFDLWTSKKIG